MTSFSNALEDLKLGEKVTRKAWESRQHLEFQNADEDDETSRPSIILNTENGDQIPWVASQPDILAEDWEIVD